MAVGVGAALMLFGLVAVRARWLHDGRTFRVFCSWSLCLAYFVVTWLGSRPWCGWPVALAVAVFLAAVLPVGVRYAFPAPTARLLRATNDRIIDRRAVPQVPVSQRGGAVLPVRRGRSVRATRAFDPMRSPLRARQLSWRSWGWPCTGSWPYAIDDALPYLAPGVAGPGRPERDAAVQDAVRRARLRGARGRRAGAATRPGGRRRGGYRAATGVPRRGRPGRRPAEPGGRPPVGQGRGGEPRPARQGPAARCRGVPARKVARPLRRTLHRRPRPDRRAGRREEADGRGGRLRRRHPGGRVDVPGALRTRSPVRRGGDSVPVPRAADLRGVRRDVRGVVLRDQPARPRRDELGGRPATGDGHPVRQADRRLADAHRREPGDQRRARLLLAIPLPDRPRHRPGTGVVEGPGRRARHDVRAARRAGAGRLVPVDRVLAHDDRGRPPAPGEQPRPALPGEQRRPPARVRLRPAKEPGRPEPELLARRAGTVPDVPGEPEPVRPLDGHPDEAQASRF